MAWNDITVSDEYKQLSPRGRARLKQRFFEESILPDLATVSPEGQEKAFNRFMETPDDTGEGLARSMLGSAARSFLDPLAAVPEVAGAFTGIEGLEDFGGDIRSTIEGAFPVNPAQEGFLTDVAGVGGQVGQIVATGGAGALTGARLLGQGATEAAKRQAMRFGATAAQQTAMGSSAVAGGLERAEQLGLEGGDRLLRGAIAGGTELLAERLGGFATELGGVGKALGFGGDTIESGFMKPILRGMVTEIPEEMGVETAGQLTDIAMAPETAPAFDFGQTAYAGLLGAVGGAAFGGIEAAITPRTKKAFEFTEDFTPSTTPPPGMTRQEADDQDLLVYDNIGNVIGYRTPQAPVTAETIEAELPVEIAPAVAPLAQNVAAAPEASATAAALQRSAEELRAAEANLEQAEDEGILMDVFADERAKAVQREDAEAAALREAGMRMLTPQQPIQQDEQITQETLQQEQSRGQELQEPRELPILPAEPTAQAPEAAVGADAAVDTQAALDTQGGGIVRDDGIVGADVELEQQKATLPVDGEGAMLQGGDVRQEETQQVSAAADVPTESLPAGQLTPRGVGVARDATKPEQMTPGEYLTPRIARLEKEIAELESSVPNVNSEAYLYWQPKLMEARRNLSALKDDRDDPGTGKPWNAGLQQRFIFEAMDAEQPVSAAAVDSYKIELPQGYTLNEAGDLYVFNATPPPQAQPQPATPATQETKPQAAAPPTQPATQESTAAQPAEAVVELTELPSYFQRNPQQKKLWDVDESYAEPTRISQSVGDKIGPRGTAFTVEQLMYQIAALREFVSNMNGRLLRGGDKGASTKELAEKWTTLRGFEALAAEYAAENPQEWQSYRNRQNELLGLESGADVIVPYPSPDTAPLGNIGKLDKKFSKNWRVIYPNGETALFHPTALRAVSDTAETVDADVIEEVTPLTQAQAAIVDKLPELEARDAQRRGLGFDYPRARIGRLPGDQNAYISRPDQKNVGVLSPDGSIKMLSPEESASIQGEINAFEKRQAAQIDKRMATLREEAKKQSESKLYQLTPSDPVVRRLDGKWINNNTGNPLGRSKNDQRLLSQLENNPNIESYQVVAQSTDGGVSFIPVSRAAQPAAGETGDAGVAISPSGETVQSSETSSPLSKLQSYISTLSPKAQAAWTPERLSAAESYYATGNESALEPLTATQRKVVKREGVSESDAAAYEAEQKRQFALRNPQAADDAEKLLNRLKELNDNATRISQAEPRDVSGGDTGGTMDSQDVSSARAKAVQRGVAGLDWANMGAEQRRKALLDFATATARSLQNNSVRLRDVSRIVQEEKGGAYTDGTAKGGVLSIKISVQQDTGLMEKSPSAEAAFSGIYKVVEEEMMHAVHTVAAFDRWKEAGSPGDFKDWFIADSVKNINDLIALADQMESSGSTEAANRIFNIIKSASDLYFNEYSDYMLQRLESDPVVANALYLEMARMLAQLDTDTLTTEAEPLRFYRKVVDWLNKALSIMRDAAKLVKTGALGEALKRDVAAITSAMREMRESIALLEAAEKQPPAATEQELLDNPNALVDSLSDETLQQERESREEAPDETTDYKKILRSADGSIRRTGVKSTPARAARNSYIGVIPGVENTWLGTVEEFDAEFPDGYEFGGTVARPPDDSEALTASDGRSFIFLDRVAVLEGDAERAEQHGTSPGVEAIKRLLRHESFIHRGYMALPGPLKNRFADFVASGIIPPEDLDFLVNNGYPHYKGWRDSKSTEMLAAEEWLAQRVERMGRIPQSGPIASIMDWLRDVWRWLTGGETTDLDKLRNTMRAMHKALGTLDPKQRIVMELPDMDVLRRSVAQTQQDQEYLAAVERGDMETAQRMVDEAARRAGFTDRYNHGTPNTEFTVFRLPDAAATGVARMGPGIYGAVPSDTQTTETYARKGRVIPMYVNMENVVVGDQLSNAQVSDMLSVLDADMTLRDGNKVGKFVDQYRSSDSLNELWGLFQLTQPEKWYDAVNKAGIEGATRFSAGVENGEIVLFKQNKVKDASPVTYDSSGAIIPPSQRFQSTSSDIRYSKVQRPVIGAQVDALSFPGVGITSQKNPMAFEREYGHLPTKYYEMAEKGQVADALQGYAKETVAPYATSKEKLLELIEILRDDRKILDTFGIGATTGQAGLGFIYAEGALQAEKMGDRVLTEAFAFGRKAVGTSKGQGLVGEKFLVNDQRYQTLFAVGSIDSTRRNEQQAVVNAKVGKPTAAKVGAEFEGATEAARDTVADAIPSELQISEKVLELGAAVQGNPTLTERVKKLISNVIDRGRKIRALQKLKSQTRASIIPDSGDFENMSEAELEAEIARLTKEIEVDMDFIEKEVAKTPRTQAPKTPVETAKAIINRVQKQAAGETTRTKPKLDRVRILYKAHLRERMAEADFMDEAKAAGLTPQVAQELYDAAELEIAAILLSKEVRGKSENYDKLTRERLKHLDVDSSALVEYINRLRREGRLGPVNWRDIMQLPPTRQQVIKGTLLELVKQNPQLQNLSAEEQQTLADALEKVWERERERQFKLQVKRLEMPGAKQEDQEKVVSATPRIIKLINQGMLADDAFYKAVGEQFGIKEMSDADRKRIIELSEIIQNDTIARADKAKEESELVSLLQKYHKLTTAEILSNVWVAHVLSGVRTQTDMALGFLNGLLNTVKKAGLVIYKNPNAKGAKTAAKGIQQFFVGLADGMAEAARYVRTEEPGLVRSDIEFINSYFEGGLKKGGLSTARKLRESDNKFLSALGSWLAILERVNTGWDVINYRATYQGTLAMAQALNPKLYKEALMPTTADFKAMEERAKTMLGANATRAQIKSRAFQYIEDGVHLLGKNLDESFMQEWKQMATEFNYDAKEAAMMVDPTGIGGLFYRGVKGITEKAETAAKARADKAKEELLDPTLGRDQRFIRQVFPPLMYLLASQARNILGVRFIRFTGNKINELISYIPIAGMARIYLEEGMTRNNELTIKAMSVQMNQLIATAIMIPALIKAMLDLEDDDEERGYIIQGPWDNLTPERKSQLMADGFKPNTIAFYDKKTGRWTSYNYINWPSAGWFATAGSVSDYRRYTPEKWDEKTAAAKFMSGIYAGGSSFLDISSISQMTELFGRSTYSTDPATKGLEKVTKLATGYAGGFVPRIAKDVDSWFDKTVYKPEDTWGHIAKEMPFYRRSAGAPLRDIFYEPVQVSRSPWSRALQVSPDDPAYKALGRLNSRGIWLTPANPENRKVKRGGKLRDMTDEESNAYMAEVGKRYKEFVMKQGDRLLEMDVDRADELVSKYTARIREIAFKRAIATAGKAAIPSPE